VADEALLGLLRALDARGYDFITPSPATHSRYLTLRGDAPAQSLRDVFGWSLPFRPGLVPPDLLDLLRRGDALDEDEETGAQRSRYRVSRIGAHLFLHSAFPTEGKDSVFLGPDTYRFVRFLEAGGIDPQARRLVDMGAGSGAGAISVAALLPGARLTLIDANPEALRLARINAEAAGVRVETVDGDSLDAAGGGIDLVIANPPFIADNSERLYRHGGGMRGAQVSLDWALAAAERLSPEGRILLYTGSAIVDGKDALKAALADKLAPLGCTLTYSEIDPDIFGETLGAPGYEGVERIAAVGALIQRPPASAR
jgi:methylase of polypeptide subunit release factors